MWNRKQSLAQYEDYVRTAKVFLKDYCASVVGRRPTNQARHYDDALAFCRKAGYRPELAWTCCDYADSLLFRNGEGDRPKAMSLLDESLAIAREMGMRPLMERVLSRREILRA